MPLKIKPQASAGIIRYHEETKHHFHRFARSAGSMDWKNQPNPFRFYKGEKPLSLAFYSSDPSSDYWDLYVRKNEAPQALNLKNIAGFLEWALALSGWKSAAGGKWSLRINPSSGNLHPTEAHLILSPESAAEGGVFHYNPFWHALERRAKISAKHWRLIRDHFDADGFLIALTSIFWRESWKYGERAFRYCNHDVGHALACLSFSGNIFGWKVKYLNALSDSEIETVLGLKKTTYRFLEEEYPDLLCFVYDNQVGDIPRSLTKEIVDEFKQIEFSGEPNQLSEKPVSWPLIYEVANLSAKPETDENKYVYEDSGFIEAAVSPLTAAEIIKNRRSAVDFDPDGFITKDQFLAMLDKTIPRNHTPPFDVELMEPSINLVIFVHAVTGLAQGLYFFFRHNESVSGIKRRMRPDFLWRRVEKGFPLYFLEEKDYRRDAKIVSCDQAIAGSGAFSLGMIANFKEMVNQAPYRYRHLFWESGMVGQVLYLEAEAQGVRGTGIGCFFDDEVRKILGLKDNHYQSLYHFTVGRPIEDHRLSTPPYHHLRDIKR